jgi:hypothetical protein
MKISLLALVLLGFTISSCTVDEMPVAAGDTSYGVLSDKDMMTYYYPIQSGWTYVYQNTVQEFTQSGSKLLNTFTAPYDTLRTLGYMGTSPDGDAMFGFDVTYRVLSSKNSKDNFNLYYVKQGSSSNGGFIIGNDPQGFASNTLDSISTYAASIDTILYAVDGPTRDVIDGYQSNANYVYRTDRIFFTAKNDSVVLWYQDSPTSPLRRVRQIWYQDISKNDDWQYALWENYTYLKVKDVDVNVSTSAGTFPSAEVEVITEDLNTPVKETKFWGVNTGLVKQVDEWRVTADGSNYKKRVKTRELISRTQN